MEKFHAFHELTGNLSVIYHREIARSSHNFPQPLIAGVEAGNTA
jgi:hypothetical protein